MKHNFVKTAIVAGLALAAVEANAATTIVGCSAPGNSTAGATVYSVESQTSAGVSNLSNLNAAVAVGSPCSRALNAMLVTVPMTNYGVTTINNSGYTLQTFTFSSDTSATALVASNATTAIVGLIGCSAPPAGTGGSTVYSIDAVASTGSAINSTVNTRLGSACTNGLMTALSSNGFGSAAPVADRNVTIPTAGYSLNQYFIQ